MEKKKNIGLEILKAIGSVLAVIVIAFVLWIGAGVADRRTTYYAIPSNFSLYARTDSAWNSVEPLLDLRAAQIIFQDERFSFAENLISQLKNSEIRKNWLVKNALKKRVDFALYEKGEYLIVVDTGILASPVRLIPLAFGSNWVSVENLAFVEESLSDSSGHKTSNDYFELSMSKNHLYGRIRKNLVLISNSKNLLDFSSSLRCERGYSQENAIIMNSRLKEQFLVATSGKNLSQIYSPDSEKIGAEKSNSGKSNSGKSNSEKSNSGKSGDLVSHYLNYISSHLATDKLTRFSININDKAISVRSNLAIDFTDGFENDPMGKILAIQSGVPSLVKKLPKNVQYYTFINSSSLEDLKNASFSTLPPKSNINATWKSAQHKCRLVFGKSLEEILFSWTGDEYAVIGLEGEKENIFALKIKDETQRQYIFDKILSSAILRNNEKLFVNGVNFSQIYVPDFFQKILENFSINVPKPYYIVKDEYIFFSQSLENLSNLYFGFYEENNDIYYKRNSGLLLNSENWKKVSENQSLNATISLYYDLQRGIPSFLQEDKTFAKILKLYNIGRFDVLTKNESLFLELDAISDDISD